ncbi:MAG: hypothetical protein K6C32_04505 [Bacilli bacterium]|nr:hypothetical protein [Bacilli bacterium]
MKKDNSNIVNINLDRQQIVNYVNEASLTCYGVKEVLSIPHKKGKKELAIYVHFEHENTFSLDIHVIIAKDVKVTETIRSLQKTIRYYMNRLYPRMCKKINIYAEGISLE